MAQMMSYAFVFLLFIENRHYFTPSKTSPFHAIVSFYQFIKFLQYCYSCFGILNA